MTTKEKQIKHIEKYENSELVKNLLNRKTNLPMEIHNFYNARNFGTYDIKNIENPNNNSSIAGIWALKENPEKYGKYPEKLVKLVEPFSNKKIDTSKLHYEKVREDIISFDYDGKDKISNWIGGLGSALGLGAFGYGHFLENPAIAIPIGVGGIIGTMYFTFNHLLKDPSLKNAGPNLIEYLKLNETVKKTQSFINNSYKNYFIEKSLDKKEGDKK